MSTPFLKGIFCSGIMFEISCYVGVSFEVKCVLRLLMETDSKLSALFLNNTACGQHNGISGIVSVATDGRFRAQEYLPAAEFSAQHQHKNREGRGKLKSGGIKE